jgi:predicted negative regulator of RcsB-dependent stress response
MKKKVRARLKTDEFVNLINKVLEFLQSNKRELMIGAAACVFIALIFLGAKYIQGVNARKQSVILGQVLEIEGQLADNPEKLVELVQLGSGGKFGRMAYIKAATHYFENGNADKALELLHLVPASRKDLIYYQSQDLLGQIYLSQNKYDEALSVFDQMERENPKDYAMDIVLFRKAQVLAARNDIDQAIELFKKVQTDFPSTYYGYEASQEAQKLEGKK